MRHHLFSYQLIQSTIGQILMPTMPELNPDVDLEPMTAFTHDFPHLKMFTLRSRSFSSVLLSLVRSNHRLFRYPLVLDEVMHPWDAMEVEYLVSASAPSFGIPF